MIDFDEIREQLDLLNDTELSAILRERDYEQWRPEVFDIVASILKERGVSPDQGTDDEEDVPDDVAGLSLVVVGTYSSHQDAEADRLALEERGLRAWVFNEDSPLDADSAGSIRLGVFPHDLTKAIAVLNSEPVSSSHLPDNIAEPPCPKCGSGNTSEQAEIVESFDASSSSHRSTPEQVWFYSCASCGHKWSES